MNRIRKALLEIQAMEEYARRDTFLNRLSPSFKILLTIGYILLVVSTHKYNLTRIILCWIPPLAIMILGDLKILFLWTRMKPFFVLVFFLGIANPFFDKTTVFTIGNMAVTGGMLSFLTLFLKGSIAITCSYLLILTTSMHKICYGLRKFHVPKVLVMILHLIYRYITIFLEEGERMVQAYAMRAPDQKGIHFSAWGPMIGQMLLRSMDRAEAVYYSMKLRGFDGDFLKDYKAEEEESL